MNRTSSRRGRARTPLPSSCSAFASSGSCSRSRSWSSRYSTRGIEGAWAGGNQVNASMLPTSFNKIGYGTIAGVPYLAVIAIVAVGAATYAMRSFRTARDFYAIGSDPAAARLAGIPVGARVFLAFVLSGSIAGIAGAFWLSYFGSVDAIAGVGYEFQVIAAVVVGGVAIFGGSGSGR